MKTKLTPYDTADYLKTEEDIAGYIDAVLEENDPQLLIAALGDVARARGMSSVAKEVGASREHLYRSLSADGNPSATTLLKIISVLGIQLHATPAK
ncbi:MAG: putative addiction module antidote protein [Coriobacteriia bacterium]|nr:putative addiction module antidote protein [Coriobacteriia bacterium]